MSNSAPKEDLLESQRESSISMMLRSQIASIKNNKTMDEILEEIFDEEAKNQMKDWDIEKFKKSHPTLFNVIICSMKQL